MEEALAAPRRPPAAEQPRLSWQDEVHCLELDDGTRRSVQRRRSSLLEYPEASEEVSFKGTMTLVGCGLLWAIILLAILSRWQPRIGWAIAPLLAVFLLMQLLAGSSRLARRVAPLMQAPDEFSDAAQKRCGPTLRGSIANPDFAPSLFTDR